MKEAREGEIWREQNLVKTKTNPQIKLKIHKYK